MRYLYALIFAFTLASFSSLMAQSAFGIHAGITVTTFNYNEEAPINWQNLVSYNFGIPIVLRTQSTVGFQTGFDLVLRGASYEEGFAIGSDGLKDRQSFTYLEIPLLVRIGNTGEDASFHFLVGPSFNFGTNGKVIIGSNERIIDFREDGIKRFELGGRFGAQIGFTVGEGRMTFDGLFRPGLTKLNDDDTDLRITSSGYDIRLGYLIPLGG